MDDFTRQEAALLREQGYRAGWMVDVKEGDDIAVKSFRFRDSDSYEHKQARLHVTRLTKQATSSNTVVVFIATGSDGTEQHHSFGATYPVFIRQQ